MCTDNHADTLVHLLRQRAEQQGEGPVFTFLGEGEHETSSLSFATLDRQARQIAAWLQQQGLSGERVLLVYPPGAEFLPAFLGCLYAGAVAVPVYPPHPRRADPRWGIIRKDAQARVVFTVGSVLPLVEAFFVGEAGLHLLATDLLPDGEAESWKAPALDGTTLALLQYTSGSTGAPRGVMVTHRNILHNAKVIHRSMDFTADCSVVSWLPSFHDMGLLGAILQPIYSGVPCYLMPPVAFLQQPLRWLRIISRYRATHSGGPNFGFDLCVRHYSAEACQGLDLSSWRVAWNGSEPILPATLERFTATFAPHGFRAEAHYPCYGLAESTLLVTGATAGQGTIHMRAPGVAESSPTGDKQPGTLVSSGTVGSGLSVVIAHPRERVRCAEGAEGEIWVAGPSVAQGYWQQREASQQTFAACLADSGEGPFLRTGDLGYLADGQLVVTGRLKDLIILRGRNYYPQDIEQIVEACHRAFRPHASAAFTVGADGGEQLVVVAEVERTQRREVDVEVVGRAVRAALAEQLGVAVQAVVLVRPLGVPKTSSGKIQRRGCRDAYLAGTLPVIGQWRAPQEAPVRPGPRRCADAAGVEGLVKELVAARLDIRPAELDLQRPLAELGLESVQAAELSQTLSEALDVALPVTLVFNYPTLAALVRYLGGVLFPSSSPIVPGKLGHGPHSRGTPAWSPEVEQLSERELDAMLASLKLDLLTPGS